MLSSAWSSTARAHAILTWRTGGFAVSVRAPLAAPRGADALCRQFDSGGYLYRYVIHDVVTFNAFLGRRFGKDAPDWLRGTGVRVGVVNLTDREPPLASGAFGFSSSVHGSLLAGRTWSLEFTRQF